eukprot:TRINITY_DN14022_c0_g1_i1.p1 TRINITY_DN14022_c0_g1~~TRINITY_DN14022_c0_g1_i1.p1  ORF type:complete len:195 (-),score=67.95 TRINITY_DN14022_c0_g1_i1:37-621(-)
MMFLSQSAVLNFDDTTMEEEDEDECQYARVAVDSPSITGGRLKIAKSKKIKAVDKMNFVDIDLKFIQTEFKIDFTDDLGNVQEGILEVTPLGLTVSKLNNDWWPLYTKKIPHQVYQLMYIHSFNYLDNNNEVIIKYNWPKDEIGVASIKTGRVHRGQEVISWKCHNSADKIKIAITAVIQQRLAKEHPENRRDL